LVRLAKALPARARPGAPAVAVVLLPLALALAGCAGEGGTAGSGGPPPGGEATFAMVQSEVFDVRCTSTTCHAAGSLAGGLSLAAGQSYDALVNVDPQNSAAVAEGMLRVKPNDPDLSFLVRKLTGELGPGEGSMMPLGGAPLPEEEIEMIRTWIADGAPRDDSDVP
jgi:hypothetical protein